MIQVEFFPNANSVIANLNDIPSKMEGAFASSIGTSLRAYDQISLKFKLQ